MTRPQFAAATTLLCAAAAASVAPARAQDKMDDSTMGGMERGVVHDPAFFAKQVLPILGRECVGCHDQGDPNNKTRHRIVPPEKGGTFTPESIETNYKRTVALLHPPAPERSLLLNKLVPLSRGGIDHDGGKADGTDFDTSLLDPKGPLVSWIFGAAEGKSPPVAVLAPWPSTVERGTPVNLDASLSYDPDGDDVGISWEVVEAPLGSSAKLSATTDKKTAFTPDRDGPYLLRCRPKDARLAGWPILVSFAATRPKDATTTGGPALVGHIPSSDRRLTRALYFDLYGRSPTEEELQQICALPYEKRLDRLLDSAETWQHWFDEEAFYFLLIDRFRPVSDRLATVPDRMREGTATFREAHVEFALSAEFNSRNPGNDTYVSVVLEQFLGIEVQSNTRLLESAKKMYDGQKTRIFKTLGHNQADVVRISLSQPDYVDVFTRRMEQRYLGYYLPDAEHRLAAERLSMDPREFKPLLREWLASDRYAAGDRAPKVKDDHQFIRGLFVDLLGRPPALQEFRNMRNALQALTDPAPLRGVLAKVMLDSGAVLPPSDAERPTDDRGRTTDTKDGPGTRTTSPQVTELFNRLLGRDPSPDELTAFLEILAEPGATWRTAALALLTSAHYQYY